MKLAEIRTLFAATCVNERLRRRASQILRGEDFGEEYAIYRFVLDILLEYTDKHERMPKVGVLRSLIIANLQQDEDAEPEDIQEVNELAQLMRALVDEDPAFVYEAAAGYMNDFKQHCLKERYKARIGSTQNLAETLVEAQEELQTSLVTDADIFANPLAIPLEGRPPGRYFRTGLGIFDHFTGGTGPAQGDVVGHAAPSGGGKSTLASHVAYLVTKLEIQQARQEGRQPGITYIFNYEQALDPFVHVLANAANVPRTTIENVINSSGQQQILSRGQEYKQYELDMFRMALAKARREQGNYPLAEQERIQRVQEMVKDTLIVVDFAGGNPALNPYATGLVDGVVEYIQLHQLANGSPGVTAVFLDYASAMARRFLSGPRARTRRDMDEYTLLIDIPLQAKHKISVPMKCFTLISQQLAADEGGKAGGVRPDPAKFRGCKAFSENCDFAFANGKTTHGEHLAIFAQAKVRRGSAMPDMIGRLVGGFSRWETADGDYTIANNRVMDRSEAMRFSAAGRQLSLDVD